MTSAIPDRAAATGARPRSPLRWRLLLATASVALTLLAVEIGVRASRRLTTSPTTHPDLVMHHERRGWAYRPGARVRQRSAEFDVELHIDARGLRAMSSEDASAPDTDSPRPEQPAETSRSAHPTGSSEILVLGDSFAFGWGVEARQCFAACLQRTLDCPVQNAGISGYGTDQELLLFRELAPEQSPPLVVLQVCGNDFEEVRHLRRYGHSKPRFRLSDSEPGALRLEGVPVPSPWLERHSATWRLVQRRLERMRDRLPTETERLEGRRLAVLLMQTLAREVQSKGGRLLVVHEGAGALHKALQDSQPPIDAVDLRPALEEASRDDLPCHFPVDGHWTPAGHAVVAEQIAAWMRRQGLARWP